MIPAEKNACPLTPALRLLLQACVETRCTHDKALGERLCLSPETVKTEFKRIAQILETHDRFAAILIAWERGWIVFPPPPRLKARTHNRHDPSINNAPNWGIDGPLPPC